MEDVMEKLLGKQIVDELDSGQGMRELARTSSSSRGMTIEILSATPQRPLSLKEIHESQNA